MISIILAMDKNKGIGKDGKLPWHLPSDLAHFKQVTQNHAIVMGRKTYESIGRPLPNRINIVMSRNLWAIDAKDVYVESSVEDILNLKHLGKEIIVIGGSEVVRQFYDVAEKLYLTYIDEDFQCDTFFDCYNEDDWELTWEIKGSTDEYNKYQFWFREYKKNIDKN